MATLAPISPLPLRRIRLNDPFWTKYQVQLVQTTLPGQYRQLIDTHRIENFARVARGEIGGFVGIYFNDSDVYKWLEAVGYGLTQHPNPDLRAKADATIDLIAQAQMSDGYINTFFQLMHPERRFMNLVSMHEMYCMGHLIEAGVAWSAGLGDDRLLGVSRRAADLLCQTFGPQGRPGYCGHEEVELALQRLADHTGVAKYRELADHFIETRGSRPSVLETEVPGPEIGASVHTCQDLCLDKGRYSGEYCQDHAPIREHTAVVGHAVRAMYLYIAAVDRAVRIQDDGLLDVITRLWESLVKRRMYVTGGIGPSASNEGFTVDYDLPNLTAYAETCASVGLAMWSRALLSATGNGDFADIMERAIYNGALTGISRDGVDYFYDNPLESRGGHARTPWFGCACCPPNIARLIGALGQYAVGESDRGLYIHIPAGAEFTSRYGEFGIESNYPWSGKIAIVARAPQKEPFALRIRIPDWADEVSMEIANDETPAEYEDGYAVYSRSWRAGDRVEVDFGMEPKWVQAHPHALDDAGRAAMTVGPLVYAAEDVDNGFRPQNASVLTQYPTGSAEAKGLEGVVAYSIAAQVDQDLFPDSLYADEGTISSADRDLVMVPYLAWGNRGKSHMQVWLRRA